MVKRYTPTQQRVGKVILFMLKHIKLIFWYGKIVFLVNGINIGCSHNAATNVYHLKSKSAVRHTHAVQGD